MTHSIWREPDGIPVPQVQIRPEKSGRKLYKVTKIQYRQDFDYKTMTASGEYKVHKKRVDYRTAKGAVTLACKHAQQENEHAERMNKERPGSSPWKYEVQIEICDLPEFGPAIFCDKHGVQPMYNVPGLTGGKYLCFECI